MSAKVDRIDGNTLYGTLADGTAITGRFSGEHKRGVWVVEYCTFRRASDERIIPVPDAEWPVFKAAIEKALNMPSAPKEQNVSDYGMAINSMTKQERKDYVSEQRWESKMRDDYGPSWYPGKYVN